MSQDICNLLRPPASSVGMGGVHRFAVAARRGIAGAVLSPYSVPAFVPPPRSVDVRKARA